MLLTLHPVWAWREEKTSRNYQMFHHCSPNLKQKWLRIIVPLKQLRETTFLRKIPSHYNGFSKIIVFSCQNYWQLQGKVYSWKSKHFMSLPLLLYMSCLPEVERISRQKTHILSCTNQTMEVCVCVWKYYCACGVVKCSMCKIEPKNAVQLFCFYVSV